MKPEASTEDKSNYKVRCEKSLKISKLKPAYDIPKIIFHNQVWFIPEFQILRICKEPNNIMYSIRRSNFKER